MLKLFGDNSLRFIKLVTPFATVYSWQGILIFDTRTFNYSLQYLDGWNYTYQEAVDSSSTYNA